MNGGPDTSLVDVNGTEWRVPQWRGVLDRLRPFEYRCAAYDSVNDAAQYLAVILSEIGRAKESRALEALAARTQKRLGYELSHDTKVRVRRLAREGAVPDSAAKTTQLRASPLSIAAQGQSQSSRKAWWQFWR